MTTETLTPTLDWTTLLLDQAAWHWDHHLRPRLEGLSDAEYLDEPVPGCWNVRPRGTGTAGIQAGSGEFTVDFEMAEPDPAPVTTIAWRMAHLVVGVLGARNASHFGGPPADYPTWEYAGTAAQALAQLDEGWARWCDGVRALDAAALAAPCGPSEGPWGDHPMAALVLHIHREVLHHGAEICLLRDLHAHRSAA